MATSDPTVESEESWSKSMREARRDRIIDAAAKVFDESGLDGASVRKIASVAGCTTGAIYPLFKNKEEIYAELLSRSLNRLQELLREAESGGASPQERRRAKAYRILDFYLERPTDFALSFYLSAGLKRKGVGEALNQRLNDQLSEIQRLNEQDLKDCVGSESAALAGADLFAHITGLLVLQLRGRFNVFAGEPHQLLSSYLDRLLKNES